MSESETEQGLADFHISSPMPSLYLLPLIKRGPSLSKATRKEPDRSKMVICPAEGMHLFFFFFNKIFG